MVLATLLGIVALTDPMLQTSFDAENLGQGSVSMETTSGPPGWIVVSDPARSGNQCVSVNRKSDGLFLSECFFNSVFLQDLKISAKVRIGSGPSPALPPEDQVQPDTVLDESGFVLRNGGDRAYRLGICLADNTIKLQSIQSPETRVLATAKLPVSSKGRWLHIDISLAADKLMCSVEGEKLIEVSELAILTYGKVGLYSNSIVDYQVDDIAIVNIAPALTQTLQISGMTCVLCEAKIENAIKALKGVKEAKANHVDGTCIVTLDENAPCDVQDLVKTVEALHYQVQVEGA